MIPLEDLRDHLRLPPDHTADDALLTAYEQAAVAAVEKYTARYFGPPQTVTAEVYDGAGTDRIWLADKPRGTPAVVVETWNGSGWDVEAGFVVDGYALYHTASEWAVGRRNVRVSYQRGYLPGEEPPDIRVAVMVLVAHWYQHREPAETGTIVAEMPLGFERLVGLNRRLLL